MANAYHLQDARNRLLDSYHAILVLSEHMENEFRRNCRTTVVRLLPFVSAVSGAEPIKRSSRRFAFVGRMTALKGGAVLLRSAKKLEEERKLRLHLVMIGDGPVRRSLERMAARMGLEVDFPGWLPPSARDQAIAGAAAIVVPSLWPEPLGLVTLEAARLGVPTVGFAVGGLRELVAEGRTGTLAPLSGDRVGNLAAALERAVANVKSGGDWGANARKLVEDYRAERHVEGLLGALRAVAKPSA